MDRNIFPTELFPNEFQELIYHLKEVSGFDTNLSSLSFLSASATCMGSEALLHNGVYTSKPILWCVLIGDSGTRKSHIMETPFNYLAQHDVSERIRYNNELRQKSTDKVIKPAQTTIIKNSTLEALFKVHQTNKNGVILFRDELAGMIKDFNRYSNGGGDKQELMQLFNGYSVNIERVTKEPVFIENSCVNLIGGIQPERMSILLNEENLADGFYFRLLFSRVNEYKPLIYSLSDLDTNISNRANEVFKKIHKTKIHLKVEEKERIAFADWFDSNQVKYFSDPFGKALQSKLESYVWRFCIILDVLDQVSKNTSRSAIIPETMENALRLAEYFRIESTQAYMDSFREGILESEPEEFQKIYRKLENREYTTEELVSTLSKVWKTDNIHKKLACPELFTRIRRGHYIKTIRNVAK
jgi:hypothetical protein